jgi:hypothetical protein
VTNISQFTWVTDLKALGGTIGFAALIPYGSKKTLAGVDLTGPMGVSRSLDVSQQVHALTDTVYAAFIGWEAGEHHWNVTLTGFAPTGDHSPNSLAITGLPFGLSAGVGGCFYQQVTGDGGVGDERLGAFRGASRRSARSSPTPSRPANSRSS